MNATTNISRYRVAHLKLRWLVALIILLPVVIDQINGYLQVQRGIHLPIAVAYRGAMIVLLMPYVLRAHDNHFFRLAAVSVLAFVIALPFWAISVQEFSLVAELTAFVKITYLLIVLIFMAEASKSVSITLVVNFVITYGALVSTIIVLAFYGGFGFPSYGENYGFGTKAFFKAGNDLGLTLLVCICVCFWELTRTDKLSYLLIASLIGFGALLIGSRATLFCVPLLFSITLMHLIFRRRLGRLRGSIKPLFYLMLVLFMATGSVLLAIWFVREVADSYFLAKLDLNAIANPRAMLLSAAEASISNFSLAEHLLGRGMTGSTDYIGAYLRLGIPRMAEADAHDMISSYGWILGPMLLLIYPLLTLKAYKRWAATSSFGDFILLITFGMLLLHSLLAGHVLLNTMLAPVVGSLYVLIYTSNRRLPYNNGSRPHEFWRGR